MGEYTPRRKLYKPNIGEEDWGEKVNRNFDILDNHKHTIEDITNFPKYVTGIITVTLEPSSRRKPIPSKLVKIPHNLPSDDLVVIVTPLKPSNVSMIYHTNWLEDNDNDGFYETVAIYVSLTETISTPLEVTINYLIICKQ